MKEIRKDSLVTRLLLLEAGYKVFCEKGFRDATIADICELAGTNIASVNYHFGSKEALYREAWLHVFEAAVEQYPVDGGVPESAPPDERLRGYIRSLIKRIMHDPGDMALIHKEMANPTGLLTDLIAVKLHSHFETGKTIVRALLGDAATDRQVLYCHTSILGQCMHLGASKKTIPREIRPPDYIDDIDAYCDHVVAFSIAGIDAVRETIDRDIPKKRTTSAPLQGES